MKKTTLFFLLLPLLCYAQGRNFPSHYKGPLTAPFVKIYVEPSQIVTLPDGIYYYGKDGKSTKVRSFLSDCDGMYVICVTYQCPQCGKCFEGHELNEEYCCHYFQDKAYP